MLFRSPVMLSMTALLAVMLTFPAGPAHADTRADTITIKTPVTRTALGGAGGERLSVTADSATPLTSMTVHVLVGAAGAGAPPGADTLRLAMAPPAGGARAGLSTWTSPDITPRVLPLGSYTLTVDAADQGGAAVSGVPAGAFPFQDTPRIIAADGDYVISGTNKHPLIGGSITVLAPGASRPVPYARQPVVLHDPAEGDIRLATNGAGAYREALPRPVAGETITAEVPPTPATAAARGRPVRLTVRTAVTGFGATLDPYWQVSYHGCLGLAPGTPGGVPPPAGLVLQYSAGPRGPWRVLGLVPVRPGRACGDDGRTFTGVRTARLSDAYYRASYPGTAAGPEADGDLASVSATAHAWKYVARVARFTVSARTVPSGGKLTVHGRLQCRSGTGWHDLARQVVQIILRPRGSRTWYWIARVRTSATGYFSATFTDPVTAIWSAEYLGDRAHLAAVGAMITVTLKRSSRSP
jgi:hypothetical protein